MRIVIYDDNDDCVGTNDSDNFGSYDDFIAEVLGDIGEAESRRLTRHQPDAAEGEQNKGQELIAAWLMPSR